MKEVCDDLLTEEQRIPDAELAPIARFVHSLELFRYPVAIRSGSALLLRLLGTVGTMDSNLSFMEILLRYFLRHFRQAHQERFLEWSRL